MPAKIATCLAACAAVLVCAAPAAGVVGGEPVAPESVPWFASDSGCGGTLVAPDRILTAAHCVKQRNLEDLAGWAVGGVRRNAVQFAMHRHWHRDNGDNVLDDVALVQLDAPVTTVAPAALGTSVPARGWILGRGRSTAPGSGLPEPFDGKLRQATLRTISGAACARKFAHARGNGGERFDAKRMLCAIDVDAKPPLSLGLQRRQRRPALCRLAGRAGPARRRELRRLALRRRPPAVGVRRG